MANKVDDRKKGIAALIFLSAVYAGTGIITRYLSYYFTFFQQIYIRTIIAFLIGVIVFRKSINIHKISRLSWREWLLIVARTAASFVIATTLWAKGTTLTKLANVAFIDSLPLTAALSFLFFLEKATFKKVFYVFLSVIGVLLLSVHDISNIFSFGYGEFLVLVAGFFYAFRNISRKWHTKTLNDQEITQLMFILAIPMLIVSSFILGEKIVIPNWNTILILMLALGGVVMIVNIFLTNYGFGLLPAVLGNNILNLEAAFGILFGFLFFKEVPSIKELVGGILIILSVVKMNEVEK